MIVFFSSFQQRFLKNNAKWVSNCHQRLVSSVQLFYRDFSACSNCIRRKIDDFVTFLVIIVVIGNLNSFCQHIDTHKNSTSLFRDRISSCDSHLVAQKKIYLYMKNKTKLSNSIESASEGNGRVRCKNIINRCCQSTNGCC